MTPFTELTPEWADKIDRLAQVLYDAKGSGDFHRNLRVRWLYLRAIDRWAWRVVAATAIRECQGVDAVEAARTHSWGQYD